MPNIRSGFKQHSFFLGWAVLIVALCAIAGAGSSQPIEFRVRYLEARIANAEALTRFEQSLSPAQKSLLEDLNRQAANLNAAYQAIVEQCKTQRADVKLKPNGEPFCAAPAALSNPGTDSIQKGTNP